MAVHDHDHEEHEMSGLTNERRGMAYIPNAQINANPCSSCGSSWSRCLSGWNESERHPAGVCCLNCHETDTHGADAARRRAMEKQNAPSGDALDRATRFVLDHDLRPGLVRELVEDIAKLIDRADAVADVKEEIVRLREALHVTAQQGGSEVDELKSRLTHWQRVAEERLIRINTLSKPMTTDQLVGEIRRRLNT